MQYVFIYLQIEMLLYEKNESINIGYSAEFVEGFLNLL